MYTIVLTKVIRNKDTNKDQGHYGVIYTVNLKPHILRFVCSTVCIEIMNHAEIISIICPTIRMCEVKYNDNYITTLFTHSK
jgi:hypothetical protein